MPYIWRAVIDAGLHPVSESGTCLVNQMFKETHDFPDNEGKFRFLERPLGVVSEINDVPAMAASSGRNELGSECYEANQNVQNVQAVSLEQTENSVDTTSMVDTLEDQSTSDTEQHKAKRVRCETILRELEHASERYKTKIAKMKVMKKKYELEALKVELSQRSA